jgi:prepilin-type N-terminal cleavage/methylation domain-containing protein
LKLRARSQGFTLAEVAVTIVIVGTMLIYLLQGLNGTKLLAASTRNMKLSRELALAKLGQISSGLYQEDIDKGLTGTFADEGYPDFSYEVVVGDDSFTDQSDVRNDRFDSWNPPARKDKEADKTDPNAEVVEKPFEKVKIRVTSPKIQEFSNQLTLEQWYPWVQVYGEKPDDKKKAAGQPDATNPAGSGATTPPASGAKQP